MASVTTPLDYLNAVRVAAKNQWYRYPGAACSVLLSRFGHGLGPRLHSLFCLSDVKRAQWDDYLVDERLKVVLKSINHPAARELVNDKLAFYEHCVANDLPTIPIVAAIVRVDDKCPPSRATVETEQQWCDRMETAPHQLFIKPIDGTWGIDAFVAEQINGSWHYLHNTGSSGDLYRFLKHHPSTNKGWIVQPLVKAHQALSPISSPHGLPTIRANTCLLNGKAELLFAAIRIPVGDNVTDNFSHGASGNIIAPIDLQTGQLGVCRGSASKRWPQIIRIEKHPDTGNKIEGCDLPMWQQVLTLLQQGQQSLPDLKTLGWDVAITDAGPLIVETNATYDVDLIQVAHQRGVGPQLGQIFASWSAKDSAVRSVSRMSHEH